MATKRDTIQSKYTLDRGIPGAFEGETVTRRRLMTAGAHGAGIIAASSFLLPALGFAIGPIFKEVEVPWQTVGVLADFPDNNYIPVVITAVPGIGEAGNTTVYVRRRNPALDTDKYDVDTAIVARVEPLRAPRLPRALGAGGRALHLPLPRRRLRPARCAASAARRCARSIALRRASSRVVSCRSARVTASTASCERFSPRDPGEPIDGIGQFLYPSRPSVRK